MEQEIWKPVLGAEEYYMVSSFGRVKSIETTSWVKTAKRADYLFPRKERLLKLSHDRYGYKYVHLRCPTLNKKIKVHRLVAMVFCYGYKPELQINHKDGIRDNNHYLNLEWVTCQQNIQDVFRRGARTNMGTENACAKLTADQVREIRQLANNGTHKKEIAKLFKMSISPICRILNGESYKNVL